MLKYILINYSSDGFFPTLGLGGSGLGFNYQLLNLLAFLSIICGIFVVTVKNPIIKFGKLL